MMKVVFFGLTNVTTKTASQFIVNKHDVVIIDPDEKAIKEVSETLDCGFLIGDASHPSVLEEVNPEKIDIFFALSHNNQSNIVAALVARSKGIKRTIVRIDDPDFEKVCTELGLNEVINPADIISQHLFDSVLNENLMELFDLIKNKLHITHQVIQEDGETVEIENGDRIIGYVRKEKFYFYEDEKELKKKDQVIIMNREKQ